MERALRNYVQKLRSLRSIPLRKTLYASFRLLIPHLLRRWALRNYVQKLRSLHSIPQSPTKLCGMQGKVERTYDALDKRIRSQAAKKHYPSGVRSRMPSSASRSCKLGVCCSASVFVISSYASLFRGGLQNEVKAAQLLNVVLRTFTKHYSRCAQQAFL